jgi:DNA-binding NarL/FixJ family response regulator
VLKESAVIEILDCLEAIGRNDYFITPALSSFLMKRFKKKEELESERSGLAALTETERKILKLIARSQTSKQIAEQLFLSPRTVDKHRENICAKLNIHGSMNLLKFAIENKHSL